MANCKVSILMATYNRADLIGRAIESVQRQTFQDWELIIVDDGSTDNTPEVVEKLKKEEPRIVYIRSEVNQGISKNYNLGLRRVLSKYVAMIDDDDAWVSNDKLKKQVEFLDSHQDYVGCGGGMIVIDSSGRELYRYLKPETDEQIRSHMLFSNPMANSTTVFRFDVAQKVGLYDETIRYAGDRDFWLKMGCVGKLYNFPEHFSFYTMTGQNTSIVKMKPHLKTSLMVMRRYQNDYPHYWSALIFNQFQYLYSFLPVLVRKVVHIMLARWKRKIFG